MKLAFWRREPEPEKRQSTQPFTDAIVSAIAQQAGGNLTGDPTAVGALEMSAGCYSRAFAGATVQGSDMAKRALTPAVLGNIGRSLIRRGESVYLIDVRQGALHLQPVGSWDVRGPAEREAWMYRLDTFGPSGNLTHFVPSASVLHCMYSYDPARPWLGLSPLGSMRQLDWLPELLRSRRDCLKRQAGPSWLRCTAAYPTRKTTTPTTTRIPRGR